MTSSSPKTNVYLDGGGVLPDTPVARDTRIRFSPTGRGEEDVTVYVEDGRVIVSGFQRPLHVEYVSPARVAVSTKEVGRD